MENTFLANAWLILAAPFAAFLLIVAFTLGRPRLSGYLTIAGVGTAFVVAVGVLSEVWRGGSLHLNLPWYTIGHTEFSLGLLVDPLTAIMLIVVTAVSLLVQIYSQGYMHGDPGYSRYFAFMALFTTSMLGLVLAPNFLQLYIFWELVGLCSYLLIGFWYRKPEAAAAAKKAFITTRLGDLGLLVGILILYWQTGTFEFEAIAHAVDTGVLTGGLLTAAVVLVFCGAVGKSAQFPLHVWLPDAMEGPTPVSALIHAATMVAAGVYLVARAFEIFSHSPEAMLVVAVIGGITAFIAASMGLVMTDIKRVMAYSTVSQLGYMMLGLGVAATIVPGITHLTNHAFFKALLFLGAGSVIHATGSQDMDEFSGLGSKMKITAATIGIASLSLAGIFPFSGFWSKDEILVEALHKQPLLFALAVLVAGMTAFYITRMWVRTFLGPFRAPAQAGGHGGHGSSAGHDAHAAGHDPHAGHDGHPSVHESPWVMTVPLILLAIPAFFSGFLGSEYGGYFYQRFLEGEHFHAPAATILGIAEPGVAGLSLVIAGAGILLGFATYYWKSISAPAVQRRFSGVHKLLINKYYLDDIYLWLIRKVVIGVSNLFQVFDLGVIDGIVNGVGRTLAASGSALREAQTGRVQNYGLAFFGGVVIVVVFTVFLR